MIRILYQDGKHQYDEDYNAITTWNDKCGEWIVNEEYVDAYNNNEIDWWGDDNDFPPGISMEAYINEFGDPNDLPDILLEMRWATKEDYQKFGGNFNYEQYDYPVTVYRYWGDLNYSKEEAIERLVTNIDSYYNHIAKGSTGCKLTYNGEVIYEKDNKL